MPDQSRPSQEARRGERKHPKLMMSVKNMLNPVDDEPPLSPASSSYSRLSRGKETEESPLHKKPKLAKDAPVFVAGKTKGLVRYHPFSELSKAMEAEISKFKIHPSVGEISAYPRHIPYSSAKKGFQQKTGREAFEVFQYTFEIADDKSQHVVMWDYNIGLVRITPFFKCCNYAKTIPGKMLAANPGLKEICHSITGGALAAQGYWMPYGAARALTSTFCHHIRHALVPLFGPVFVDDCVRPGQEGYGQMIIDPEITKQCMRQAAIYREQDKYPDNREHELEDACRSPAFASASTPIFTEPVYSASADGHSSDSLSIGNNREMRQQGRQIDQEQGQWSSPAWSCGGRERRNAFAAASPEDLQYYLPSPRSDTGGYGRDTGMRRGGGGGGGGSSSVVPRSHPVMRLPSPHAMLAFKFPPKSHNVPPNSPSSLNDDLSYADNSEYRTGNDSDDGSLTGQISPKSTVVASSACGQDELALVDGSPSERLHRHLPRPRFNAGALRSSGVNVDDRFERYKAAWMLLQLHKADSKLEVSDTQTANTFTARLHPVEQVAQPRFDAVAIPVQAHAVALSGRRKRRASM